MREAVRFLARRVVRAVQSAWPTGRARFAAFEGREGGRLGRGARSHCGGDERLSVRESKKSRRRTFGCGLVLARDLRGWEGNAFQPWARFRAGR